MNLSDFLFVLILAGSIQGIITGILLFNTRLYPSRILAFLVWLIALPGIHLFAHHAHWFTGTPATDLIHALIPWVSFMALGPLIYCYIRSVCEPGYFLAGRDRLHFIPVMIDLLPKAAELCFWFGLLPVAWIADRDGMVRFIDTYGRYTDLPRWVSFACYVYVCARYLNRAVAGGKLITPWVGQFIIAMKVFVWVWLIYLIPYLIPATAGVLDRTVGWFPVYIPLAALIYWIGIAGYRQAVTRSGEVKERSAEAVYDYEQLALTAQKLAACMKTDRLFLDPELDVSRLAQAVGVSGKLLSATLNQHLNSSFSQYINAYRVAEFKKRVSDADAASLTLAGLAASCGFSSQATFQRIFKQFTGMTPAVFKKNQSEKVPEVSQIRI